MLMPAVMVAVAPSPIVVMNRQAECRLIVVMFAHMPAIAIAIADDLGRRRGGRRRQSACSDDRGQDEFFHGGFSHSGSKPPLGMRTQFHAVCSGPSPLVDGVLELK